MFHHPINYEVVDWAVDEIAKKYLDSGGKESEMRSRENLELFFEGLCYREGERVVRDFVNNYVYHKQPVYYRGYA